MAIESGNKRVLNKCHLCKLIKQIMEVNGHLKTSYEAWTSEIRH